MNSALLTSSRQDATSFASRPRKAPATRALAPEPPGGLEGNRGRNPRRARSLTKQTNNHRCARVYRVSQTARRGRPHKSGLTRPANHFSLRLRATARAQAAPLLGNLRETQ
ncbi:hypothetical protein MRX96_019103 [Rhipicephalus microplus]